MGLIAEESINAIREKTNIVDVVSNYVTLKKAGRSHKGVCPFHREKTPSFVVDAQKQLFHCFGCSEGGNVFNFLMKIENIDFVEAAEMLAKRSGVSLKYASAGNNKRLHNKRERFFQINKEAADFYHYMLMQTEQGKAARQYLKNRTYGKNVATTFKLGYAPPNKNSLLKFLLKKDHTQQEIIDLYLAYVSSTGQTRDRFFNRLMFPIEDARGNIVGFGGRVLDEKDNPKYLNSAQTPVFHKSEQFYGLNLAKKEIVNTDQVIIVEGYTDVISMHQNGFANTVATLGTAVTEQHIEILSRFCSSAIMLFDSDSAGVKAATRTIDFVNITKLELLVAILPQGDPADFVLNNGSGQLKSLLKKAVPVVDFCLQQIVSKADLKSSQKRMVAIEECLNLIKKQENAILEQEYLHKLANLLGIPVDNLIVEYKKKAKNIKENEPSKSTLSFEEKTEQLLLAILLERPDLLEKAGMIVSDDFSQAYNQEIFRLMHTKKGWDSATLIDLTENAELKRYITELSFLSKPQQMEAALQDICKKIKDFALKKRINIVKTILEKTNPVTDRSEYDKLFKQLIELEANRRDLKVALGV